MITTTERCPYSGHLIKRPSAAERRMTEKEMKRADEAREIEAAWAWETRDRKEI